MMHKTLLAAGTLALSSAQTLPAGAIDISTRVANWQGIPDLDNPWEGYPVIPTTNGAGWLGQGVSQTFSAPAGTACPTYSNCLTSEGCTPGSQFTGASPAVPGCAAGCVAWEATLTINIPFNGKCAIIQGTVAADDNIAIKVVNSRYPQGQYVLGSSSAGVGVWNVASTISPAGQTDAVTGEGYFADGVNTLTMRIDNRQTCLMLAGFIDAHVDPSTCPGGKPPNPPNPPPSPAPVIAVFDPHFTFHHGGKADFKGEHNAWYNLLSAQHESLNVLFTHADFNIEKPKKRVVHGSHMKEMALTVTTSHGRKIVIEYNSTANNGRTRMAMIREVYNKAGAMRDIGRVMATTDPTPGNGLHQMEHYRAKKIDDVHVTMTRQKVASMASIALSIDTGRWVITAWSVPFPNPYKHPGKTLLNVRVAPHDGYDPEKDAVAPHGIIGQSYDGDGEGIDGAEDDYAGVGDFTTAAMAEGAIEGQHADYKMPTKYSTDFKYSRFGLEKASPRDVSKLTGKRVGKERREQAGPAGSSPDVAPTPQEIKGVEVDVELRKKKA